MPLKKWPENNVIHPHSHTLLTALKRSKTKIVTFKSFSYKRLESEFWWIRLFLHKTPTLNDSIKNTSVESLIWIVLIWKKKKFYVLIEVLLIIIIINAFTRANGGDSLFTPSLRETTAGESLAYAFIRDNIVERLTSKHYTRYLYVLPFSRRRSRQIQYKKYPKKNVLLTVLKMVAKQRYSTRLFLYDVS